MPRWTWQESDEEEEEEEGIVWNDFDHRATWIMHDGT